MIHTRREFRFDTGEFVSVQKSANLFEIKAREKFYRTDIG